MQMDRQSFEKELLQVLKYSALKAEQLQELVRAVVDIREVGVHGMRVFPKGIPAVDRLEVRAVLSGQQLEAFMKKRVIDMPRVGAVEVFPYGIPVPEIFSVGFEVS
jgi:hypothetical protein